MALLGFQQDPNSMPGAGWFHPDVGEPVYAYHPELANQLSQGQGPGVGVIQPAVALQQGAKPGGNMQIQGLGFAAADQRAAAGGGSPALEAQLAQMPDFGGGPKPAGVGGGPATEAPPGQPAAQPPGENPLAPSTTAGGAIARVAQDQLGAAMLREGTQPVRRTPAHYQPSTKEMTVSDQGSPMSAEDKGLREDAYWGDLAATQNRGDLESAHLATLAEQQAAQAKRQETAIAFQQKVQQDTSQLVAKDQNDLDQFQSELQQSQKDFNPNRLFSGAAGTMAGIGAAIFRAMGAYASSLGHQGSNAAGEVIDAAIQRDIMKQRADIEAHKGNADNALARLTKHYGNMEQATAALSILQNKYADTQALQLANATGSQDVILKTQQDIAAKQEKYAKQNFDFQQISEGKHSAKVSEKYVQASQTGGAPSVDKLIDRNTKLAGLARTEAETDKLRAEAGNKGGELVVPDGKGGTIQARTKEEATELRTSYGDLVTGQKAAQKMVAIAKDTSTLRGASPFTLEKERIWNTNREALMHAANNALTGKSVAVREASMQRFEHALAGQPGSPGAAAAIQEMHDIISGAYQNKLDSQLSPGAKTPSITPKGATEYTGAQ